MEIPNRTDYDAAFARKLSRLNARQRRELIALLGHPPNIANVPASFWEKVRKENEDELAAALLLLFAESFFFHARAAGVDPRRLQSAGLNAAQHYAATKARETADAIVKSARERIEKLAAEKWSHRPTTKPPATPGATAPPTTPPVEPPTPTPAQQAAIDAANEVLTKAEVAADVAKVWGPTAAAATAVTETTAAQTAGGEAAVNRTVGISDDDIWRIHPELSASGTCPICRPYDGRPRRIWAVEFPAGPPAHRNCNCEIIYAGMGAAPTLALV